MHALLLLVHGLAARAPPPRACAGAQPTIVAIDFDVLCATEAESTVSSWRVCCKLWPGIMEQAAELDPRTAGVRKAWTNGDWSRLEGVGPDGMPAWLREKMRALRPTVRAGVENVLLCRLCCDEALAAARNTRGSRPLSVGEIQSSWGGPLRATLAARYGMAERDLAAELAAVRDAFHTAEPDSWHAANELRAGAAEALRACARVTGGATPILLTRYAPEQSAALVGSVLERAGVDALPDECVLGLGADDHADALLELQRRHEGRRLVYVDDRAQSIRRAAADERLLRWELCFASWGYTTPQQVALVARMPRVRVLASCAEELPELLCAGAVSGPD